jgi:hypothetical protein
MITLKKNDKLIIIIAVAVIIVAAIGIAAYEPLESDDDIPSTTISYTYEITWDKKSGSLSYDEYAGKKSPYEHNISINQDNLCSITFNISWKDDKTFLGRLGRDTVYVEIRTPDGTTYEESKKSSGKSTDNIVSIGGIGLISSIEITILSVDFPELFFDSS